MGWMRHLQAHATKRLAYASLLTIGFLLMEAMLGYGFSRLARYFDIGPSAVLLGLLMVIVPVIFVVAYQLMGDLMKDEPPAIRAGDD